MVDLKQLPADQRPRERLLALGPAALTDAELLALLLRTGLAGQGVLALAQAVLDGCGGFAGLLRATPADLARTKGLGPAKRAELAAVAEIARRALAQQMRTSPVFESPAAVADYCALMLGGEAREVFVVLHLDAKHRLLGQQRFEGSIRHTDVSPREVVREALARHSAAVVCAHNHPSGDAQPSGSDVALTHRLRDALALVDVRLLDHLVIGQGQSQRTSLFERGLL